MKATKDNELIDLRNYSDLAIDAEWGWRDVPGGKQAVYLSVQLAASNKEGNVNKFVYFLDSKCKKPTLTTFNKVDVDVIVVEGLGLINLLEYLILPKSILLHMFYSPKDLEGLIGRERWKTMLLENKGGKKTVTKKRRLNVKDFKEKDSTLRVLDLIGMANSSLDDFYKSVGINSPLKNLASIGGRDKGHMELFADDNPNEFMQYGLNDVADLVKAKAEKIKQTNEIIETALGLPAPYTTENMKFTSGALVSDVFERWLMHKYPDLYRASMILTTSNSDKELKQVMEMRRYLSYDPSIDFTKVKNREKSTLEYNNNKLKRMPSSVHGLAAASIRAFFPGNYGEHTVVFNSVVQGGRCVNENPEEHRIENVLDVDLAGCYGSSLCDLPYVFGVPTVYETKIETAQPHTLGSFLKEYEKELIPGLFVIYVSGMLPFHQDLIPSKYGLTTDKIACKLFMSLEDGFTYDTEDYYGREIEAAHMGGKFEHTTQEIELGVITTDVLEVIRKVSSNTELKAWMDLKVTTSAYYPKSKETTQTTFFSLVTNEQTRVVDEKLLKAWCRIPLAEFVGKFIDTRKSYKKQMKGFEVCTPEYEYFNLRQNAVKLFINTTYGCLAAPYFNMSSTILANNITAKARTGVWMMAKALNLAQTITDGGLYAFLLVNRLRIDSKFFKKPGFNNLYQQPSKKWRESVETIALFDKSIISEIRSAIDGKDIEALKYWQNKLDTETTTHVNNFWSVYGLKLAFDIEHKIDHTGYSAAYNNSGDNSVNVGDGKCFTKVRGTHDENHPKRLRLEAIAQGNPLENVPHTLMIEDTLGVSAYQLNPGDSVFLPGDTILRRYLHTPNPYHGKLHPTAKEAKIAKDKHDREVREYKRANEGVALENIPRFHTIR